MELHYAQRLLGWYRERSTQFFIRLQNGRVRGLRLDNDQCRLPDDCTMLVGVYDPLQVTPAQLVADVQATIADWVAAGRPVRRVGRPRTAHLT